MSQNGRRQKLFRIGPIILTCILWAVSPARCSDELDLRAMFREGIPPSPFSAAFYGCADAMLQHGRDSYGPQKSGLLLSALDRKTLSPLKRRPPAPAGIRDESRPGAPDQPLLGANPQLDENLLRLLLPLVHRLP